MLFQRISDTEQHWIKNHIYASLTCQLQSWHQITVTSNKDDLIYFRTVCQVSNIKSYTHVYTFLLYTCYFEIPLAEIIPALFTTAQLLQYFRVQGIMRVRYIQFAPAKGKFTFCRKGGKKVLCPGSCLRVLQIYCLIQKWVKDQFAFYGETVIEIDTIQVTSLILTGMTDVLKAVSYQLIGPRLSIFFPKKGSGPMPVETTIDKNSCFS